MKKGLAISMAKEDLRFHQVKIPSRIKSKILRKEWREPSRTGSLSGGRLGPAPDLSAPQSACPAGAPTAFEEITAPVRAGACRMLRILSLSSFARLLICRAPMCSLFWEGVRREPHHISPHNTL